MKAGLPPSATTIVVADIPGAVDAKPDTVERSTARVPANALKVDADIIVSASLPLLLCAAADEVGSHDTIGTRNQN